VTVVLLLRSGAVFADSPGIIATPLAPKSQPAGATMFTLMPAAQTGIVAENAFADPKMWSDHYQEFVYGAIGTGVAIGDYDNDGRPDVFVVSKTGQSRLFRNLGNWKFEDVTEKAGLLEQSGGWLSRARSLVGSAAPAGDVEAWKQGAAFADVNNDGWLDLYICRWNAPNLLYINQHDGTFKEEAAARGLAVSDASGMAEFCDYDRDGWLDVYIHTNMLDAVKGPKGQRDYLFHNNGDGTFTNVTDKAGISGVGCAHSGTWWDFNEDGWPDLYVANDYDVPDKLYRNNGDGTFTDVAANVLPHTPYYAMGADLGDVNNDGHIDLLVADMAGSTHEKDQRGMAGSRDRAQAAQPATAQPPQYMRSALYLNSGVGRMREAAMMAGVAATDWTWSVRFEDLDNDGWLDLHVTNGMVREFHNADMLSRIMSADSIAESWKLVRAAAPMRERHFAFRNRGDLQFEEVGSKWGLDQVGVSFGAAFGDLDGDGDLDLVYANYDAGVTVLRNDAPAGHRLVIALRGTRSNRFGVGAAVRIETDVGQQVRSLVLARGQMSTSEPIVHFGLGDTAVVKRLTVVWPSGTIQTLTNVAADQRLTITEAAGGADVPPVLVKAGGRPALHEPAMFEDVSTALGLDLPSRDNTPADTQPLLPERFNHRGPALAAATNRDDPFLVLGGTREQSARVLRRVGGKYVAADLPAKGSTLPDGPIAVFDADGDGRDDILITKSSTGAPAGSSEYQPILYRQGEDGRFVAVTNVLPAVPISAGAVAVGDFNRDGKSDVFLGGRVLPGKYPLSPASALLVNHAGRFEDVTDAIAPALREVGMVTAALWVDVDRDGWPDLVVATEWGPVRCFHNDGGRGFSELTDRLGFALAGTGLWTALAMGDFNGDGRPDFVAGNLGLNTPDQASAQEPALLFYGDFGGKAPLAIEAYFEAGRLYPREARAALGALIPSLLQRYRRTDAYAKATLEEVVGKDRLDTARRFAATELRSGVFLSQPDGTYRFAALPRIAQIAPWNAIVVGDFNGDGNADIYAVQNSSAPPPAVGNFDGGLSQLLLGDGRGGLKAIEPEQSGFVVPGDAKAALLIDVDGDGRPDIVGTRNNGPMFAFRRR
jgi:hypothetical protein